MSNNRRYYYWIVARDPESGKLYLILGDQDENKARMRGLELLPNIDFELKRLPTRDTNMASRMIHGKRLEETHSLKHASKRIGRAKSLNRFRHKYIKTGDDYL